MCSTALRSSISLHSDSVTMHTSKRASSGRCRGPAVITPDRPIRIRLLRHSERLGSLSLETVRYLRLHPYVSVRSPGYKSTCPLGKRQSAHFAAVQPSPLGCLTVCIHRHIHELLSRIHEPVLFHIDMPVRLLLHPVIHNNRPRG